MKNEIKKTKKNCNIQQQSSTKKISKSYKEAPVIPVKNGERVKKEKIGRSKQKV